MPSIRLFSSVTLICASALFVACGDSTAPEPLSVDSILGELRDADQSLGIARGSVDNFAFVGVPFLPFAGLPAKANCPFAEATQSFVCASTTQSGITTSLYYQLLDASDEPQSAFDPATTAAIRMVNAISGTMTTGGANPTTTTIDGQGDHTLSGLLTGTHTLNGSSTMDVQSSFTFGGSTFESSVRVTETMTNLVLPRRGTSDRYPKGSIAMDMTSTGGSAFNVHMMLTFNGSPTATMVITSDGFAQTCTIDLTGKNDLQCVDG